MRLLVLFQTLLLLAPSLALDGVLHVENPHAVDVTACCPAQSLPPDTLLEPTAAVMLKRQADTFVDVKTRKHLGAPVTVFNFRQSVRLTDAPLPFDLALVTSIDPSGIVEVPAPSEAAEDSWFPDYAWSHFVVCTHGEKASHLGWRFTRKQPGAGPESFVALIVRADEKPEAQAEAEPAMRVPVSVAVADVEAAEAPGVELPIGMPAPGWMSALVAAVTARAAAPRSGAL